MFRKCLSFVGIPIAGFAYIRGVEAESRRKLVADAAGGAAALSIIETKGRAPLMTATFFASVHRIAAALVAVIIVGGASSAHAVTLLVDDDNVQCPSAPYTTIQAAVAASSAGDTVKLCAGLYGGQVVINHPLKIFGKAPQPETCSTLPPLSPSAYSIFDAPAVAGPGGIGIDVLSDGVTIQDVVIRGAGEAGIRTDPAHVKFKITFSVFTLNANGLDFHSAGTPASRVTDNCFHQNGTGIRTGYGLKRALIQKNYFFGNVGAGIFLDQLSATTNEKLKVQSNRSMNDATFAVIIGTVDSRFVKNKMIGNATTGAGIVVGGNNVDLLIKQNAVQNPGTHGIRFNTQSFPGFPPSGPSSALDVTKNDIMNAGTHGITIESVAGEASLVASSILKNEVTDSGDGGTGDGIRVEDPLATGPNSGNEIEANIISGSANHDCHDPSGGNTWSSNLASTQSVANLCFTGAANGVAD